MAKTFLTILIFIPIISFSQAIGIKGGFNISNIKSDLNTSSLVAPSGGIIFFTGISKVFDIGIEPTYSTFGGKQTISFTDVSGVSSSRIFKVKYHYLEIPVSLNFYPVNEVTIIGLHGGISPMFYLSKSEEFLMSTSKVNSFIAAPFAGGSFGYKFSKKLFFNITARYQFPMSNIYKDSPYSSKFNSMNFFLALCHKL